jgi:hypothetical protein
VHNISWLLVLQTVCTPLAANLIFFYLHLCFWSALSPKKDPQNLIL